MNARILIIDDDPELATMLGEFLRREGYAVEAQYGADAGVAALRAAEALRPKAAERIIRASRAASRKSLARTR